MVLKWHILPLSMHYTICDKTSKWDEDPQRRSLSSRVECLVFFHDFLHRSSRFFLSFLLLDSLFCIHELFSRSLFFLKCVNSFSFHIQLAWNLWGIPLAQTCYWLFKCLGRLRILQVTMFTLNCSIPYENTWNLLCGG